MKANFKTYLLMYCKRNKIAHAYFWSNDFQIEIIKDALLSMN